MGKEGTKAGGRSRGVGRGRYNGRDRNKGISRSRRRGTDRKQRQRRSRCRGQSSRVRTTRKGSGGEISMPSAPSPPARTVWVSGEQLEPASAPGLLTPHLIRPPRPRPRPRLRRLSPRAPTHHSRPGQLSLSLSPLPSYIMRLV